jgi:hypothetical protein
MEEARERVAAACLESKYKDDRHDWSMVMIEDYHRSGYALRRCGQCYLMALLWETELRSYGGAPGKADVIVHAFFAKKPTEDGSIAVKK